MYQDPTLIRKPYGRVNLNGPEAQLIDAIVAYTGGERSVVMRDLLLSRAAEILAEMGGDNDALTRARQSA